MKTIKDELKAIPFAQLDRAEDLLGFDGTRIRQKNQVVNQLAAIQELVAKISQSPNLEAGCKHLADLLAEHFDGCVHVGVCLNPGQSCQVLAASEFQQIDLNQKSIPLIGYAMEEAIARGRRSEWPCENPREQVSLKALKQLTESAAGKEGQPSLFVFPLLDEKRIARGVVCFRAKRVLSGAKKESVIRFFDAASPLLAAAIGLHVRAEGNRFDRLAKRLSAICKSRKSKVALLTLGILLLVMLIPVSYKVHCNCVLQPVVRRFVGAPFAGRLENSFVEPGDMVSAGDTLARIDGRDVNWELSGKKAELNRAVSVRDGHLAAHRSGEARVASLEVERLKLAVDQLEDRAKKLEIQSPISGMIVVGDLTKSEGVVLETGQMLYEIAPLDHMVVEVAIPENDIRFVEAGMSVNISLDAFPNKSIQSKVRRVHPRAELIEHQNVFIAELEVPNDQKNMRPGMKGAAWITTKRKSIGWIVLHKAYESVRRFLF